jgi:hypothetical protein
MTGTPAATAARVEGPGASNERGRRGLIYNLTMFALASKWHQAPLFRGVLFIV